jgi:choline dehydrogenase-like flavoprotein
MFLRESCRYNSFPKSDTAKRMRFSHSLPTPNEGNHEALSIMIGEKAAAMILKDAAA